MPSSFYIPFLSDCDLKECHPRLETDHFIPFQFVLPLYAVPRITIARVYRYMGNKMKFLWGGDLKLNTVHVEDVCGALWHLTSAGETKKIYNLVDKNDTDQKKLNNLLEGLFGIKTGFVNSVMCKLAKLNIKAATDTVNDRHLRPWSALCNSHKIESTPLSPYLAPEILYDHSLSVDGSALIATGYTLKHPNITVALLQEALDYWTAQHVFPVVTDEEKAEAVRADEDEDDELPSQEEDEE